MKSSMNAVLLALLMGLGAATVATPMEGVVKLIKGLKSKVVSDGKAEQASFDEYACWCEKTLERKAGDISASKELISETEILISKLKGEIASHGAEVAQLKKDIAHNLEGQKDATAMRAKENDEYTNEKMESEQCIGALDAAIKVLSGAGTKQGFLDTSTHKAQLLSVAGQLRSVYRLQAMSRTVSAKDLDLVKNFVAKPEDFMASHLEGLSAAQVGQTGPNPFGDYAPQSSQIQGILKSMHDAFNADLTKDIAAEAESLAGFQALIATKKSEQATLESTLEKQETDHASKTKRLKESEVLKDDTADQLAADEAFFADSKDACKARAGEWSVRTRLRTEELNGMQEAIDILEGGDKTFKSATTTFLQLASVQKHRAESHGAAKAYGQLSKMATQFKSLRLAKIAAAVQMGGHFDKVLVMIDDMVSLLRKEEASDIVHRDLCENSQNANKNDLADLSSMIDKANAMKERMGNTKIELQSQVSDLESEIKSTEKTQADMLNFRNKESGDFKQALKDDTDAVGLIRNAISALEKFYKDNKIPLGLTQKPEYAKDQDKAPDASSFSGSYGGRQSESGGILAILAMLAEDLEKEIAEGRGDDADAQDKYAKQNGALQNTLDAQEETKVSVEEELAGLEEKIDATEAFIKGKSDDKSAEGDAKAALATDCAWVKTHFETRQEKRKDEIQGLVDAKAFLAGVEGGEDPLPPVMN